jgi:hypothetical protein
VRRRAAALILGIVYDVASATPALAAGPDNAPCSGDTGHSAGEEAFTAGIEKHGASGTIEGQDLHQCTNPGGFETSGTFAWAALGEEAAKVVGR